MSSAPTGRHPAHLCAAVPPSRAVSVLPESPVSLLQEESPWQRSFSLSFFFWFVFFKRLKASCYASPRHMRGSTCFPHTAAPHLRPQPCKVLESKHQWIRVRTFQMAGLRRWTRLPRKLEHSLPSRSCAASLSPRRPGGSCFSPASSPKVSPRVREEQGRAEARGSGLASVTCGGGRCSGQAPSPLLGGVGLQHGPRRAPHVCQRWFQEAPRQGGGSVCF